MKRTLTLKHKDGRVMELTKPAFTMKDVRPYMRAGFCVERVQIRRLEK